MNILTDKDFRTIELVRLNRDGKVIGRIVEYKKHFYYLSPRTDEHFFIKFRGFGVDRALLWTLITKKICIGNSYYYIDGIIIHYKGRTQQRFLFASLDTWYNKGEMYGTSKEVDGEILTYGDQKILAQSKMDVFGYEITDSEVQKSLKR